MRISAVPLKHVVLVSLLASSAWTGSLPLSAAPGPGEATVLFTSNRDGDFEMFAMKPDGSGVRQLTHNTVKDSRGRWSPDGTKIYFIRNDEQVWVMDADGANQTYVTAGKTVAVSPDGAALVVSRYGGPWNPQSLFVYNLALGEATPLADDIGENYNPDFTPDGSGVVYVNFFNYYGDSYKNLMRVDLTGGNKRALTSYNEWQKAYPDAPRFSPNGGLIVFSNRGANQNELLQTISSEGTGQTGYFSSSQGNLNSPVWSPDGNYVLSSMNGRIVKTDYPYTTAVWLTSGSSADFPTDWFKERSPANESAPVILQQPQSRMVPAGSAVTFQVSAIGNPPPAYQWQFNGEDLPDATAATLVLNAVTSGQAGIYRVRVSNSAGEAISEDAVLTVLASLTLAGALDQPDWIFTTGGAGEWFAQTDEAQDGIAAARSGPITHNQESWLETTVTGPGELSFWWKVSSESGYDWLEFYMGGARRDRIAGTRDWHRMAYDLAEGPNMLRWRYVKDGSASSGADAGWLDRVAVSLDHLVISPIEGFTPSGAPGGPFSPTEKTYLLRNTGEIDLQWSARGTVNWVTLFPSSGLIGPGDSASLRVELNGEAGLLPTWDRGVLEVRNESSGRMAGARDLFLQVGSSLALGEAVNAPHLPWFTGPAGREWAPAVDSHDGQGSARSAPGNDGQPWIETQVTGPGRLTFWWRLASAAGEPNDEWYEMYDFYIFEGEREQHFECLAMGEIELPMEWRQHSYEIGNGVHTFRWVYLPGNALDLVAWLDAVTFIPDGSQSPVITLQPQSQTAEPGGNVIFQVAAEGTPPPAYQWRWNGEDLPGETGDTLVFNSVTGEQAGAYTVRASNIAGSVMSDAAVLTVQAGGVRLAVSIREADGAVEIALTGEPSAIWTIQASSDLAIWSIMASQPIPESGRLTVLEPGSGHSQRYYRAVAGEMPIGP